MGAYFIFGVIIQYSFTVVLRLLQLGPPGALSINCVPEPYLHQCVCMCVSECFLNSLALTGIFVITELLNSEA